MKRALIGLAAASIPLWPSTAHAMQSERVPFTVPGDGFSCDYTATVYVSDEDRDAWFFIVPEDDPRCYAAHFTIDAEVETEGGSQIHLTSSGNQLYATHVRKALWADYLAWFDCSGCEAGASIQPK